MQRYSIPLREIRFRLTRDAAVADVAGDHPLQIIVYDTESDHSSSASALQLLQKRCTIENGQAPRLDMAAPWITLAEASGR